MKLESLSCVIASSLVLGAAATNTIKLVARGDNFDLDSAELQVKNDKIKLGVKDEIVLETCQDGMLLGVGIDKHGQLVAISQGNKNGRSGISALTLQNIVDFNIDDLFVAVPDKNGYKIFVNSANTPSNAVPINLKIIPSNKDGDEQNGSLNLSRNKLNDAVQNVLFDPSLYTGIGSGIAAPILAVTGTEYPVYPTVYPAEYPSYFATYSTGYPSVSTDLTDYFTVYLTNYPAESSATVYATEYATDDPGYPVYATDDPGYPVYATDDPGYPVYATDYSGYPVYATDDPGFPVYATDYSGYPVYATDYPGYPAYATGYTSGYATSYPTDSTAASPTDYESTYPTDFYTSQPFNTPSNLSVSPLAPDNSTATVPPNMSIISPSPMTTETYVATSSDYTGFLNAGTFTTSRTSSTGLTDPGSGGDEVATTNPFLTNSASKRQVTMWYTAIAVGLLAIFILII